MEAFTEAPAGGKTAEEILKSKAKIERARLKRVAARGAAKPKVPYAGKPKAKPAKKSLSLKAKTKANNKARKAKAKKAVKPAKSAACVRSERLDMRLTKAEKAKVHGRAKALRRTVTSIVIEAIEKIK